MNRLEHFKEAEALLEQAQGNRGTEDYHAMLIAEAQVHATLACAEVPGR